MKYEEIETAFSITAKDINAFIDNHTLSGKVPERLRSSVSKRDEIGSITFEESNDNQKMIDELNAEMTKAMNSISEKIVKKYKVR